MCLPRIKIPLNIFLAKLPQFIRTTKFNLINWSTDWYYQKFPTSLRTSLEIWPTSLHLRNKSSTSTLKNSSDSSTSTTKSMLPKWLKVSLKCHRTLSSLLVLNSTPKTALSKWNNPAKSSVSSTSSRTKSLTITRMLANSLESTSSPLSSPQVFLKSCLSLLLSTSVLMNKVNIILSLHLYLSSFLPLFPNSILSRLNNISQEMVAKSVQLRNHRMLLLNWTRPWIRCSRIGNHCRIRP